MVEKQLNEGNYREMQSELMYQLDVRLEELT
jgi:hypothetical protein